MILWYKYILQYWKDIRSFFRHLRCHGVVVVATAKLHLTKPAFRFCVSLNLTTVCWRFAIVILWQWSKPKTRLNTFHWSTIPQKQFIIVIPCQCCICKNNSSSSSPVSVAYVRQSKKLYLWSRSYKFSNSISDLQKNTKLSKRNLSRLLK